MKRSFIRFMLCAAVAVAFTACEKENGLLSEDPTTERAGSKHGEGYFRATFFPQQGNNATRAGEVIEPGNEAIKGDSKSIQELTCYVYQKQEEGEDYILFDSKEVIKYDAQGKKIQSYTWPLTEEVSFELPNGEYKAVFVGNATKYLFTKTVSNELLTGVDVSSIGKENASKFSEASLNMPEGEDNQPIMFEDVDDGERDVHNMLYLCTVDFSEADFDGTKEPPQVLMQRVVSQNVYGRDFVDSNDMLATLVNQIVEHIADEDFVGETVRGLLKLKLISIITGVVNGVVDDLYDELGDASLRIGFIDTPVGAIVVPIVKGLLGPMLGDNGVIRLLVEGLADQLVDPLLTALTADLLEKLNEELLNPVLGIVNKTLNGEEGSLLGLNYLLNPWQHVNAVNIEYQSLTKSIGFDREVKAYYTPIDNGPAAIFSAVPVIDGPKNLESDENVVRNVYVTTLSGKVTNDEDKDKQHQLSSIVVDKASADNDLLGILGLLLDDVDNTLIGGLLVNIQKDLNYPMESNLQYNTRCELLNLTLNNFDDYTDGDQVKVTVDLGDVLPTDLVGGLVDGLLHDGKSPLTPLLEAVTAALGGIVNAVAEGLYYLTLGLVDLTSITKPITNLLDNIIAALTGDGEGNSGLVQELVENLTLDLDIYLPSLGISNIRVEGSWDDTTVSNGAKIPAVNHKD